MPTRTSTIVSVCECLDGHHLYYWTWQKNDIHEIVRFEQWRTFCTSSISRKSGRCPSKIIRQYFQGKTKVTHAKQACLFHRTKLRIFKLITNRYTNLRKAGCPDNTGLKLGNAVRGRTELQRKMVWPIISQSSFVLSCSRRWPTQDIWCHRF